MLLLTRPQTHHMLLHPAPSANTDASNVSCCYHPGTDITPIVPALEKIWRDSRGQSLADFNFRTVTSRFNELVYQYPIRIPERYSLVIRSLLTQVSACYLRGRRLLASTLSHGALLDAPKHSTTNQQ